MERLFAAWSDEQIIVTRCLFCDWSIEGPAAAGRTLAAEHRAELHPWARRKRRKRTGLFAMSPRQRESAESKLERTEATAAAELRRKAMGVG